MIVHGVDFKPGPSKAVEVEGHKLTAGWDANTGNPVIQVVIENSEWYESSHYQGIAQWQLNQHTYICVGDYWTGYFEPGCLYKIEKIGG